MKMMLPIVQTAFFLVHFFVSTKYAVTTSSSDIPEVKAATPNKKKKRAPNNVPKGITLNIFVRERNTNPTPKSGVIPKAKTAGNIAKPAISAMSVSNDATIIPEATRLSFLFR